MTSEQRHELEAIKVGAPNMLNQTGIVLPSMLPKIIPGLTRAVEWESAAGVAAAFCRKFSRLS